MESKFREIKFTDKDIVNKDDFIPEGEYNPRKIRPWLIHDNGFVVCMVFASSLQDALDEAVDADKLDNWMVDPSDESDRADYMVQDVVTPGYDANIPEYVHTDGTKWWWKEGCEPNYLGNASEPFDIESLQIEELPNPKLSFCTLFNAMQTKKEEKL